VLVHVDKDLVDFIPDEHAERMQWANLGVSIAGAVPALMTGGLAIATRALSVNTLTKATRSAPAGTVALRNVTEDSIRTIPARISYEAKPTRSHVHSCPGAAYACARTLSGAPTSGSPEHTNQHLPEERRPSREERLVKET
jgi:hypothetical protein